MIWIVLLALCLQGAATGMSAVRGPSHVHAHAAAAHPVHDRAARRAGHFDAVVMLAAGYVKTPSTPSRAHHHDEAQHHYHLPGGDVVLVRDDRNEHTHAMARTARGESAGAAFLALIPGALALQTVDARAGFSAGPAKKLASRPADRIERPPRYPAA